MTRTKTDKRSRLIQTAVKLAYRHGFRTTSLADIAEAAKVPVGNVYYSSRRKMRSARPLWSNVYWNFGRCGKSGTGRVPRKNAFRRVSRIRLRTGMCLHAEGAPLGRFVPSCTRKAGLSRKNLRHYSESRLRG